MGEGAEGPIPAEPGELLHDPAELAGAVRGPPSTDVQRGYARRMQSAGADPLVSVVVRTRNRPTLLREALRDIQAQEFQDFEIVLVDDGDGAADVEAVLDDLEELRGRVQLIDHTSGPHGRARAANAGLREARGSFVVLHDDDDSWSADFLAVTTAYLLAHPDAWAVATHTEVVVHRTDGESGEEREERVLLTPELRAITIPDMLKANRITTHSFLYRRAVHEEIGFLREDLPAHEDWEFYLRFIARHPIDLLPLPARAFWHHRPEAVGDQGNSVFVLDVDHESTQARIRDEEIRAAAARTGWGPALHLSHVAASMEKALDARAAQLRADHDDVRSRLEAIEARLDDLLRALGEVHRRVDETSELVMQRTSVGGMLRRVRSALRR